MTSAPSTSYLKEQLAGLAFCQVQAGPAPALTRARAAGWHNLLRRLGVVLPLYWVHDFGLLLSTPRAELRIAGAAARAERATGGTDASPAGRQAAGSGPDGRRRGGTEAPMDSPGASWEPLLARYQELLHRLQQASPLEATAALHLRDELVAVVLVRTCGELARRLPAAPPALGPPEDLPLHPALYASSELGPPPAPDSAAAAWLRLLTTAPGPLHLQTAVELIDPDTLRLLSLSAGGVELLASSSSTGGVDLLELLAVLQAPEARDIVRFSLELLPTVLETRRPAGAHSYPTGGYAALQGRGSLDVLVLSELASDEDVLYTRYALGDLLYYGREQQHEPPRRLHYVLIDASPSMRGLRQVFARGLALSLCKRLALLGGEVVVRFFDARLHEAISTERTPARVLPYVLGFRSQRGRNYGRVFRDLVSELAAQARATRAARRRAVTIYLLTHAECHIPTELVKALRRQASLYGVFTLPSGELQLDYLPLLHRYQVVAEDALGATATRRARALAIVDDASASAAAPSAGPAVKPGANRSKS